MRNLAGAIAILVAGILAAGQGQPTPSGASSRPGTDLPSGRFSWTVGEPLVAPADRPDDPCHAIKDPSVVRYEGKWHLFCTIRSQKRTHQIEYLSFADWKDANSAKRHLLAVKDDYYCAPQVFFFTPHKKWYLVYQAVAKDRKPPHRPMFSTTTNIADPASWTKAALLVSDDLDLKGWLDFWVICDDLKAHLFFTTLDGRMWRMETKPADFPAGWGKPAVALQGDIFEASHTYRLKGMDRYLTLIEAQDGGRRYYKAYLADRLEGKWTPLADSKEKPFASAANIREAGTHWTDSVSHGELLRDGYDERLEVDPANPRFLFQGVTDEAKAGKEYGDIPWRLGILEPVR